MARANHATDEDVVHEPSHGEDKRDVDAAKRFVRFFLDYGLYTYLPLLLSRRYGASAVTAGWLIAASASGSILTAITVGHT